MLSFRRSYIRDTVFVSIVRILLFSMGPRFRGDDVYPLYMRRLNMRHRLTEWNPA